MILLKFIGLLVIIGVLAIGWPFLLVVLIMLAIAERLDYEFAPMLGLVVLTTLVGLAVELWWLKLLASV